MPLPPLNFPYLPGRPVPGNDLHLKVTVNSTVCTPPQEIAEFHDQWLNIPLREIVLSGAIHYQNTNLPILPNEHALERRMRSTWEDIWKGSPRSQPVAGRNRLLFGPIGDPDEQTRLSYILGDTIGVAVAKRIYGVSYAAFTKRNYSPATRHDFEISVGGNAVMLETRGRYDKNHRIDALQQIAHKFGAVRNFNRAMGVLVYPSNNLNRSIEDVEIVDPEGDDVPPTRMSLARQVLSHYLPYFDEQNVSVRLVLRGLIAMSNEELESTLSNGASGIVEPRNARRIAHFGRTSLPLGGDSFYGTYFAGWAAPRWGDISLGQREGLFYWGISRQVIKRLGTLELFDLLPSTQGFQATVTDDGVQLFLFDDGILIAWTPDWETLQAAVHSRVI